jgi:23S rRNA (cytidine2498-2'-O)-methyltransferase
MDLLIAAPGLEAHLESELSRNYGIKADRRGNPALFEVELPVSDNALPSLAFARQWIPQARRIEIPSIRAAAETAANQIVASIPANQPWRLQIAPHYGSANAGINRCRLIRESLLEWLQKRRRHLRKQLVESNSPFSPNESVAQLILTSPDEGFLSIAAAPLPAIQYRLISPFPKGEIPIASDKAAPSRAFAKLVEAELRLGQSIASGETCVDLGATPGSWSYVAVQRGAMVHAVDRSPLREDLMNHPRLIFHRGDAFSYAPEAPVDWLLCDVIAAPDRSIGLLTDWLKRGLCRRFIVTIKFKGDGEYAKLEGLKRGLETLAARWSVTHLCANKNEACAYGFRED